MTTVKIDPKPAANATFALEPLTSRLYANPGMRIVAVVELAHVERTQPAPDEDKEASVKLAIKHLEVARDEQEDHLRKVLRALYLHRTAQGTLDDAGEVELSQRTLELAGGMMDAIEAARLRVAVLAWRDYARQSLQGKLSNTQLRDELQTIGDGLAAVVNAGAEGR